MWNHALDCQSGFGISLPAQRSLVDFSVSAILTDWIFISAFKWVCLKDSVKAGLEG